MSFSSLRCQLDAAAAICRRDWVLFASHRMRLVTTMFTTVATLTLFHYISRLVHSRTVGAPNQYYAFVVIGVIVFIVLTSVLSTPIATLRSELQTGTFERFVLSAFGPVRSIGALLLFPVLAAVLTGVVALAFAALAFSLDLHWPTVALALPVALLGAAAFAPFGLAMSAAVVLFKQTNAGATFVVLGVTLLAGVYYPVALLPDWIRWASEVQPFTPTLDLLRHLLVGAAMQGSAAADLGKLVGFALVGVPLGLMLVRAAVRISQRRGTIIEY